MLLSDERIIELVNSRFVPVWESIRPVPKVTIDFGDGRTLQRTLTGNTMFSVLLPDGRMVDAYPGVYTPNDLLPELRATLGFLDEKRACGPAAPAIDEVGQWHRQRADMAVRKQLMSITFSKRAVEAPLLAALGMGPRTLTSAPQPTGPPDQALNRSSLIELRNSTATPVEPLVADPREALRKVTERIVDVSHLPASAERIRQAYAGQPEAVRPTPEKLGQMAVEQDSRTNLTLVRPAVHLFFAAEGALPMARPARDAIFRRLLQVPIDDPDLGLTVGLPPGTPASR